MSRTGKPPPESGGCYLEERKGGVDTPEGNRRLGGKGRFFLSSVSTKGVHIQKTLTEEEVSLSSQVKHLVILEAQTKDGDEKIVNLGDRDNLPVDYISKEGDVNSMRATAGSSPVSSISNASSAPQLEDTPTEEGGRPRDNGIQVSRGVCSYSGVIFISLDSSS